MRRVVPNCLARLPQDLDLSKARGKPTGLARLVFVLLLMHADDRGFAFPSRRLLARLSGVAEADAGKALCLLQARGAIERRTMVRHGRPRLGWLVRLEADNGEHGCLRVFFPQLPQTRQHYAAALEALARGLKSANYSACVLLMYQFARTPELPTIGADHPLRHGLPPNYSWISRVLSTSVDTVRRAKRRVSERGLARCEGERLVFEDPQRWPELLGFPELARPRLELVRAAGQDFSAAREGEPSSRPSGSPPLSLVPAYASSADVAEPEAASDVGAVRALDLELVLNAAGWDIADQLDREILAAGLETWGPVGILGRLLKCFNESDRSRALESLGHELGPEFHEPRQRVWQREDYT